MTLWRRRARHEVTPWFKWFLENLATAVNAAQHSLNALKEPLNKWQKPSV